MCGSVVNCLASRSSQNTLLLLSLVSTACSHTQPLHHLLSCHLLSAICSLLSHFAHCPLSLSLSASSRLFAVRLRFLSLVVYSFTPSLPGLALSCSVLIHCLLSLLCSLSLSLTAWLLLLFAFCYLSLSSSCSSFTHSLSTVGFHSSLLIVCLHFLSLVVYSLTHPLSGVTRASSLSGLTLSCSRSVLIHCLWFP